MNLFSDVATILGGLGSLLIIISLIFLLLRFNKKKNETTIPLSYKIILIAGIGFWLCYAVMQTNVLMMATCVALVALCVVWIIAQNLRKGNIKEHFVRSYKENHTKKFVDKRLLAPDADVEVSKVSKLYNKISSVVTKSTGSPAALMIAVGIIIVWAISGPVFNYSDTWQLVINTGTTIITFLMVFIIQQSQNKDTTAVHLKLNELIAVNENASNRLVDIEDLSDKELEVLKKFYIKISELAENEKELFTTHSLDEATANSSKKTGRKRIG